MPIEKIIEDMNSKFDKAKFEYNVILNAKRYYDRLLRYFRGRYEQMLEVKDYFLDLKCQ